ncbi:MULTISPECIES: FkbM family methyltransferase [Microcoleaceae]|uniref:FkbM family methyltransferase n=1 Tax=Microcoleaceae TaxID=1892252 RepID=UPI0030846423
MPIFVDNLKKNGKIDDIHLTIAIVGSRNYEGQEYEGIDWGLMSPNLTIYGFDADRESCEQMNAKLQKQQISYQEKHIPLALWDSVGTQTLYITKSPYCSSLYPPSESYIDRFTDNPRIIELVSKEKIQTTTLDDFCHSEGINEIDFIQIDTQGGELKVLEGAKDILKSILFLKVEVEFTAMYENQPLFADIDLYLRKSGFTFLDFETLYRDSRRRGSIVSKQHPGQLIWTDAFYFRDLIQQSSDRESCNNTPEKLLKLACIADILSFYDVAMETLEWLTWKYGDNPKYNFANNIAEVLSQLPDLAKEKVGALPAMERIKGYLDSKYFLNHPVVKEDELYSNLKLRKFNLIIFPDWLQSEEKVGLELQEVIKSLVTHPDRAKMTLLIDNSNISAEDADLILSSVAMNLLMESELEVDEGPEIVLVGELSQIQWSALIPQLQGRIKLDNENQEAIAQAKAEKIALFN